MPFFISNMPQGTPLTQTYKGRAGYYSEREVGRHLLVVAIECRVDEVPFPALLDTGSQWCVMPAETARALGLDLGPESAGEPVPLSTRPGTFVGRLERMETQFP